MKTNSILSFSILTLGVAFFGGCAHSELNQQLDAKLEKMPAVTNRQDLGQETKTLIQNDTQLTADQKTQLLALEHETATRIESLWQKTAKLRSVLIKDLINVDYNEGEVEIIKDKMRSIEDQRIDTIFSAVKRANVILDKQVAAHSNLFNGFLRNK